MNHSLNNSINNSINSECYICLEYIDNGEPLFELECCKNTVHLGCLKTWLDFNRNRTKCFVCYKYNKFCDEMTRSLNRSITNENSNIYDISNTNIQNQNNTINKQKQFFIFILSVLFILAMIIIFSLNNSR